MEACFLTQAIHHIDADMAVRLYSQLVATPPGSQLCMSGKTGEEEMREKMRGLGQSRWQEGVKERETEG